jgi:hypothetical protein
LSLCHEDIWGSEGIAPPFLTPALDGGEWSDSRPDRFTLEEGTPGTHWLGSWVGLEAGMDAMEERQILHCRESNPGRPVRSPSLYRLRYSDSWRKFG